MRNLPAPYDGEWLAGTRERTRPGEKTGPFTDTCLPCPSLSLLIPRNQPNTIHTERQVLWGKNKSISSPQSSNQSASLSFWLPRPTQEKWGLEGWIDSKEGHPPSSNNAGSGPSPDYEGGSQELRLVSGSSEKQDGRKG